MSKKEILIICLILCFICSLQAVVAADCGSNSTDINVLSVDNNVSSFALPSSDTDSLEAGNEASFQNLQEVVNNGGTGFESHNYTWTSGENEVTISNTITLDGQGKVIIDAKKQSRIFNIVNGATVTLKGITFINGNANENGGSIFSNGILTIENCNFINNTAGGHGGAIYLDQSTSSTIDGCYFTGNVAGFNGGAVDWHAGSSHGNLINSNFYNNTAKRSGGAIYWSGHYGTISNTNFTNNTATGDVIDEIGGILGGGDGGAVIWVGSHGAIKDNCNFINNAAAYRGGAIFLHGNSTESCTNITVDNATFKYNAAGLNGGAIDWQEGSIDGRLTNSIFINNTASRNGGAVFWYGQNGTIINCNFTDNSALGTVDTDNRSLTQYVDNNGNIILGGSGGAIVWTGNIGTIDNCNFIHNNAYRLGGAVFLRDNNHTTFSNSHFTNNTARLNGGAIDFNRGAHDGSIINTTFDNNTAGRSAGAVFWFGDTGSIINSNFTHNKALGINNYTDSYGNITYGGYGGSIVWTGSNGIVEYCYFINNEAQYNQVTNSGGRGGAVYLQGCLQNNVITNCTNISFNRCIFINNIVGANGGAIAFDIGATDNIIKTSNFIENYARRDGAAVNFAVGSINNNITDSRFENNSAGDDGGAINWEGNLGTIHNITCYNNTGFSFNGSTSNGGTICITGNNITISDSRFELSTVMIGSNEEKKPHGGAIFLTGNFTRIINTAFDKCYCPDDAGAIYIIGNYTLIDNCTFENCHSFENGGVMLVVGDYFKLYNSTFTNNYGGNDGGAINWQGSHGMVYNITCTNNRAVSMGTHNSNGGTMSIEGDNITISKSKFSQTGASIAGGAIFVTGNLINITDSVFQYCNVSLTQNPKPNKTYSTGGGAIYVLGNDSNIENCNFSFSNGKHGGVIYIQGNNVAVNHIITDFTYAPQGGGAIYVQGENATIQNSNFTRGNSTQSNGGSIYIEGANANILNSNFSMSMTKIDGGTIYVQGVNATIEKSNFAMNNATRYGGTIYINGDLTKIIDTTFKQSHAVSGGVLYISGNDAYINGTTFLMSSADINGGAVYIAGNNVTIEKSVFDKSNATGSVNEDNHIDGKGGAIYVEGNLASIKDSNFSINIAVHGSGGAIYVGGENTTISGISTSISQAPNGQGGAIYIDGKNTIIEDSKSTLAFASKEGGSIYIKGDNSKLIDSNIIHTSSNTYGGAVYIDAVNATVLGSNFVMNNATEKGGSIYIKGVHANIINSTFNLTNAKSGLSFIKDINLGGAVYIEGDYANIEGSNFTNSNAFQGGVIYLTGSYCNVTNSSFDNSYSYDCGGAIYSKGTYSTVYGSNFTNNLARSSGGAILWYGNNDRHNQVLSSLFVNNTAMIAESVDGETRGGGAIYWYKYGHYVTVKDSIFINNSVQTDYNVDAEGGAMLMDYVYNVIIDNCVFDNNYLTTSNTAIDNAWIQGGAMYIRSHNLTIQNSVFKNCWSIKEAGAVYVSNSGSGNFKSPYDIIFDNVTFINNTAKSEGQKNKEQNSGGGALQVKECKNALFENLKFFNNTAYQGGALSFGIKSTDKDYFVNCTFSGNNATTNGGSIYATLPINLENIYISDSYAGDNGGGLYATSDVNYNNLSFINNTADYGGGFYWYKGGVTVQNMLFENNTAVYNGGAFYSTGSATFKYNNFTGNDASEVGGAIYIVAGTSNVQYNNFTNNSASYGGAVYVNAATNINYNNFNGNDASEDGGAIYVNGNSLTISYNNFTDNSANNGGAIYAVTVGNNALTVLYSNFTSNHAINDGGAIYGGYKLTEKNCNFINNAAWRGGAIFIAASDSSISSSNFIGNNATSSGGAIFISSSLTGVTIDSSTFKNSHADDGGAIYNDGSTSLATIIKNDIFINNTAEYNGGAVLYKLQTSNGIVYFRDYNNFDGRGVILDSNRTDVTATAGSSTTKFIQNSLFENNFDYPLIIETISDIEVPVITINLLNPHLYRRNNVKFTINLTRNGELFRQINITDDNFFSYYNDDYNMLYVTFDNLPIETEFNITVGFSDNSYLYKENSTNSKTQGTERGDFQLLQYLIEKAISEGIYELNLTRSYRFIHMSWDNLRVLDNGCMNLTNISKPFTINGHGWAIDARGFSRIFNITASNITFNNVMFINGNASGICNDSVDVGGAIFWVGTNGTLNGCTLENNHAEFGGGIYFNATATGCKIVDSEFISNGAVERGGAIDCNATKMELVNTTFESNHAYIGAALCRETNATGGFGFNNTFTDNHADYAGAALALINSSSIRIDTYFFYNNTAGYSGGAIYVGEGSGNCEIENCVFDNNYITEGSDGHGGAIEWYAEKGYVINSIFTNNHAPDGGAIYVGRESGKINITDSIFSKNYAATVGGAISLNASSITIKRSNFYDNHALEGGALYVGGEGETNYVYDSVFKGNNATGGNGGAINWMASSGTIIASNLTDNNAYNGGGIYFGGLSQESYISNCIFTNNHAKYNGGAIDCNSSNMYLNFTTFDGNYAQFGAALCRETNAQKGLGENNIFINNHAYVSGAALGWMGSIGIKIMNYTFINNTADISGGAIYIDSDSHNCLVIDSNFENNYVTNVTSGGMNSIYWTAWDGTDMRYQVMSTSDTSLINKTIIGEDTTTYYCGLEDDMAALAGIGGAINCLAENATIINTNFTGNYARLGGALYVGSDSGNTNITNDIFTSNHAYERGGAINLYASAVDVKDSKFYYNLAVDGAALYVGGIGTKNSIRSSVFEGNNATGYGAGVYWIAQAGVINQSNFTNNLASYGGGIFFNGRSANTNLTNSIFKSNNATRNGGAIECNASNIGIYNLTFVSNYAGQYGAALCRESGATGGHGTNNTFIANHADISGAGLAWLGVDNIHIVYYKFINNTAYQSGAGIYISDNSDNAIIDYCVFTGNRIINDTGGHGGAIDVVGDNPTIINSNFTSNYAFYGGAVWFDECSGYANVSNATFTKNSANVDGGAINLRGTGIDITNARFYENTAVRNGGAVYAGLTGKTSIIHNSVFEGNHAGSHGGAVDWRSAAGEIINSNFTANTAEYGGGIYLNGISSNSRIQNVIFTSNEATKNGGAIDCNASMMALNNTQFISNYAGEYGAALCSEANATGGFGGNNTFIKNHADIAGAAFAWLGVEGININNYTFINNTADLSGGAIFVREDSSNCIVRNSYFDNNYVTDVRSGRGGAIDWLGSNGMVVNTTFENSFAVNGGTIFVGLYSDNITIMNSSFIASRALGEGGSIVLMGDNARITDSNFTYSIALERGGVIAAHNAYNTTINNCYFYHSVGAGYVDPSLKYYGEGGAIFFENAADLNISNSLFLEIETHNSGGSLCIINCNDSVLYNLTFQGQTSVQNGGSVSWVDSTNITVDSCIFDDSAASFNGGAIYFDNINDAVIKNSKFNNTSVPRGNAGAVYVNGNATIDNSTFTNFKAINNLAGALFFKSGISTVSNSSFDGPNTIWINQTANVSLIRNNITGENSNRNMIYLEDNTDEGALKTSYAVWNDGDLSLEKNNFTYIILNNGTIWTETHTRMLNNRSYVETWNELFTFFANITDDNYNTIISAHTLNAIDDVTHDMNYAYIMHYNKFVTRCIYQGESTFYPLDNGLKKNNVYTGNLKVKMPVNLEIIHTNINQEKITFYARLTTPVNSNYTINGETVQFKIGDKVINAYVVNNYAVWSEALANITENHLPAGTYTITANYTGDNVHWGAFNSTLLVLELHPIWITIHAADIYYGQTLVLNVASNATNTENGYITIWINGKEVATKIKLNSNGTATYSLDYNDYKEIITRSGEYTASVMFSNSTYYEYNFNYNTFEVFKVNADIEANVTTPIVHPNSEIINVTVNETATGYIKITIDGKTYVEEIDHGKVQFNIPDLPSGTYINCTVEYSGDDLFNGDSTNVTFTVNRASDYVFDVKVDDIIFGQNATVMVLVPTQVTGNVTIYVDGKIAGIINVTDGTAILSNISGLSGGVHVANATYNGDANHNPISMEIEFNVKPTDDWKMDITIEEHPYGENTTIYIDVSAYNLSNKNLTVTIDGIDYIVNLTGGKGNLTLNNLSAGVHSATVNYAGDANYSSKSQIFRLSIPKADTTVTLTEVDGNIIATVSGNATGNVTFYVNGNEYTIDLVAGNATLPNDKLRIGNNTVVAIYNGDDNYTSSRAMDNFTVDKLNSIVNITVNNTVFGNDVKVVVEVGKNQTGFVTININDEEYSAKIKQGKATFTLKNLAVGNNYRINVTYEGNEIFKTSTNYTYFNVTKANLDVTVIGQNVTVKENASFIITVPGDFDGKVNITVNGTTYTREVTSLVEIDKLLAGNKNATLLFYNSTKYANKEVNVSFTVSRIDATINVTINDVTYPNAASAIVKVSNNANGTIEIYNGETLVGTGSITNGEATVSLNVLAGGAKEVTVKFISSDYYNNNVTVTAKFTVNRANTTVVISRNGTDVIATVDPSTTGNVTFYINGVKYENITVNGNATIKDKLGIGRNSVVVIYNGNENYTFSENSTVFDVVKISTDLTVVAVPENVVIGENTTITVTMVNVTIGKVLIEVNGYNYTADIINGEAVLTVALPVNQYTATAYYLGDGTHYASNKTSNVFNVLNKTAPKVNITAPASVEIDNEITFTVNTTSNATLTVKVNGVVVTKDGDGKYHFTGANVVGRYNIAAEVAENDYYFAAVNSTIVTVYKHNATITNVVVPSADTFVGQNVTINVTMGNVTSGILLIEVGGHNYTVVINNYNATLTVALPVGDYTVKAYFLGDDSHNASVLSNATVFKVVGKRDAIVIINAGKVVEIDGKLIFTVTNSTPVVVTVNGKVYTPVDGNYTFVASVVGNYTIVARSAETDEYYVGFDTTTFVVVKHNSTLDVGVDAVYYVGDSVEITVYSNSTVNVTVNGKVYDVVGGIVTVPAGDLVAGDYTVAATVYESDKYLANSTTKTFKVIKYESEINVTTASINVGETAVINITTSNYNGTVIVNINGTNYSVVITNGEGQLKVSGLGNGTYNINVTSLENAKYLSGTNKTTLTVSKVDSFLNVITRQIASGEDEVITFNLPTDATGNITVVVNRQTYYVAVSGGKGTLTIPGLHKGDYLVNATYNGDSKYAAFTNNTQVFKVIQHSTEMTVVDERNRTVTVHLPENATGNVTIEVNGETYNGTLVNGTATITLTNTTPGVHQAHVIYSGNDDIEGQEALVDVHIPKYATPISVNISEFKVGDVGYINVTLPNGTTGMVIIEINDKSFNTTDIVEGVARFEISGLTAGIKTFIVEYFGDDNFLANDTADTLTVNKHNSNINVAVENIEVGGIAQINVTGPNDISGVVIVNIDGTNYTVILTEGEGFVKVAKLGNGTYDIKVTYLENAKYLSSVNDTEKVTVSKVVSSISAETTNITLGQNAVFEITLPADATGTVTINVNGTLITVGVTGGVNRVIIENLTIGTYEADITYNGNDKYLTNSTKATIKVGPASIKGGVSVEDLRNGTVIVHVPEDATGNITIKIGDHIYNTTIENGSAIIELVNETPGSYNATVIYSGDENNTEVTFSSSISIDKYVTPISVEVGNSYVGDKVQIIVTVDGNVTNNVTVEINGVNHTAKVDNGKAVFEIDDLTAGNKTVVATYAGDDWYLFNSTTKQFTVSKRNAPISVECETSGESEIITISGLPANATGYVIVKVGDTEYGINITTTKQLTVPISKSGTYEVTVNYLGDDQYLENSTSTSFKINIEDDVTIDVNTDQYGEDVTVKVTVPEDATGNVTVKVGNTTKVVEVTGGENIITIPDVGEGSHEVNVTYSGDDKYDSKTVVKTVYVFASINVEDELTRGWGSSYDYEAEFLDAEGHVIKNTDVHFIINGKTYTVKTDDQGIAYLRDANLPVGTYEVTSVNPVTGQNVTHKLTIVKRLLENKDITMDFEDGTYYVVRAIGDDGKPVGEGEFVDVYVNTIHYSARIDKNGYARLKINLNPGEYSVTSEYKNTKVTNKLVVKQTFKLVKKTVKVKKGKKLVLKAKLKWSNGKAIRGKVIKFKFKGKTYKAKTNSKGIAKVTIKKKVTKKLKKGKIYKFTAKYLKNPVKGKVKVK